MNEVYCNVFGFLFTIQGKNVRELFDLYLNTCPYQGSRTIRTEVLVCASRLISHGSNLLAFNKVFSNIFCCSTSRKLSLYLCSIFKNPLALCCIEVAEKN